MPVSRITHHSQRGELLRNSDLIIWDKCLMKNKSDLDVVDHLLQDLTGVNILFRGKRIIFSGDFRQILPVVPSGSKDEIISSCIKHSGIWDQVQTFSLTISQRICGNPEFVRIVNNIGNGVGVVNNKIILSNFNFVLDSEELINFCFPDVNNTIANINCAILCGTNIAADNFNRVILQCLNGDPIILNSSDSFVGEVDLTLNTVEFLNSLQHPGVPEHTIVLKANCICILMRNISSKDGLMNNCKVIVRRLQQRSILVEVASTAERFTILRISFWFKILRTDLEVERRQFPL
jgi:hypothetical protein